MTLAHDAVTSSGSGTGNLSWTHTPVGTPRGVVVVITQYGTNADQVSGVTYGGVTMTEVWLSPFGHTSTNDNCQLHAFHLGANIPTGNQTVAVTVSGANTKVAACYTVTGAADTELDDTTTYESTSTNSISASITCSGAGTYICGSVMTGNASPSSLAGGTGATLDGTSDLGSGGGGWAHCTDVSSGAGGKSLIVTQSADDGVMLAVGIKEIVPAGTRKTRNALADANVKTINGLASANIKTTNGLT